MSGIIQRLLPMDELFATVRRFPLAVLCAVTLFVIAFLMNHGLKGFDDDLLGRVVAILACLYFWFGISKLIAEGQKLSFSSQSLLNLVGGVGIILLIGASTLWGIHLLFVLPALLLGIMFAPYLKGGDDLSFWFFNRQMWFGVIISYAALILFAGGLSAALLAIKLLFGVGVGAKLYADIWLFASLVLGPVYALSWVPKKFQFTPEDCNDPPGLQFIVNWISAPMIFVYMTILYAYFLKIGLAMHLPNGHLAYLITGFIGAGVVTYLVAWPMRESGSPQLRAFYKIFFFALIIPVGFHFLAVWERISAYGFTEQRYFLLLSAVWFAVIAFSNVLKRMPIKLIPMTLCVLMMLASFGPWGAVSVSGQSQYGRLITLMERNSLLDGGKAIVAKGTISEEDRISISSILQYLCRSERDEMLRPMFEFKKNCSGYELTKQLGFDYVHHHYNNRLVNNDDQDRGVNFNRYRKNEHNRFIDIKDYDVYVQRINLKAHWQTDKKQYREWNNRKKLKNGDVIDFAFKTPNLKISVSNDGEVLAQAEFNLNDYADANVSMIEKNDTLSPLIVEHDAVLMQLDVKRLNGKAKDDQHHVTFMEFDLFYRLKP